MLTHDFSAQDLAVRGEIGDASHLLRVTQAQLTDGPGAGMRVVDIMSACGFALRLLPDRGLDIGDTWFRGIPVAWRSRVGETRPGSVDSTTGWLAGWGGGLLTTCGLHNVGEPSDGYGQHGSYTDLSATELSIVRFDAANGVQAVKISAALEDSTSLGARFTVHREITVFEQGAIVVSDQVRNDGSEVEQAPFLYHVNAGSPFLSEDSRLVVSDAADDGVLMGPSSPADVIREHEIDRNAQQRSATISSPRFGLALNVAWDTDELGRVHSWQRNVPGAYVLAVEPANCGLKGRAADRAEGRAPFLAPGDTRRTSISFSIRPLG